MAKVIFPHSVQKRIEENLQNATTTTLGFLLGKWMEDTLHIFGCYRCPSEDIEDVGHCLKEASGQIPLGTGVCGLFGFYPKSDGDDKVMREIRMTATRRFKDQCSGDHLVMAVFRGGDNGKHLQSTFWYHADGRDVSEADAKFTDTNQILDECVVFRLHGSVKFVVRHDKKKDKVIQNIAKELGNQIQQLKSNQTAFHIKHSHIVMFLDDPPYARTDVLTDDTLCRDLFQYIEKEEEEAMGKKRKVKLKEISKEVVHVNVMKQIAGPIPFEKVPDCSPYIVQNQECVKYMTTTLPLDVIGLVSPDEPVGNLPQIFLQGLVNQLTCMGRTMCQFYKDNRLCKPKPYHYKPDVIGHLVTLLQPTGWSESDLESYRRDLSQKLMLPLTRPTLRCCCRHVFPDEGYGDSYLRNTHVGLSRAGVKGSKTYIVDGTYAYHHYMQDKFDDNGWGCAYRSLQTIVSWFRHQGYTEVPVPSHRQIQQVLVDVGDKQTSFVGSRKWIGSTEVGYCLDHLLGVTSKFMFVSSGAELAVKGRELAMHFESQGTPIMIGGGVLAHTILGVDFNDVTGDLKFLILDPHYTGGEDIKVIQDKGWCGWKGPDFWNQQAFYNLCMPQRPVML
ncbi:ufm1-specific protease 2-like [Lineus longissimus]|uniref:ufm1-specific protease 2-like n=1 Tax=Lineus longissimus TaxID=88925 RepID=UPI002B4D8676